MTIQFLRGTTAANNATTGQEASLTVDTTADNLRLHDGVTAGGVVIPNETGVVNIARDATAIQEATVGGQNFTYKTTGRIVAFSYFFATEKTVTNGAAVVYTQSNVSSPHYSTTTGLFTAPVDGIYQIGVDMLRASTASTGQLDVWLSKNGETFGQSLGTSLPSGIPALFPVTLTACTSLLAGDTLAIRTNGTTLGSATSTNLFYGYLL